MTGGSGRLLWTSTESMKYPALRCSMTGLPIADSSEAIWDDGEWISWAWIYEQIALEKRQQIHVEYPEDPPQPEAPSLRRLVSEAVAHDDSNPGTPSRLWGLIGELYVAERFGVLLSRDEVQGHDGRLGMNWSRSRRSRRTRCVRLRG